ncbi:MAG: hypothetical protein NVSMB42_24920 [Herpetosiphon sp.]
MFNIWTFTARGAVQIAEPPSNVSPGYRPRYAENQAGDCRLYSIEQQLCQSVMWLKPSLVVQYHVSYT